MALSKEQINTIIDKHKQNQTVKIIANEMQISPTTVQRIIKKYKLGESFERKVGSGIKYPDPPTSFSL